MKLFACLAAMTIACVLLFSLSITAAFADDCYEMIKYTFSVEDNGDFVWLGQGMLVAGEEKEDPEQNDVFFYVSFDSGLASVVGRNADGAAETCMWMDAEPVDMLLATVQVAASYEELSANLTHCNELVLIVETSADEAPLYLSSAEEAQAYVSMMKEAFAGAADAQE